MNLILPAFVAEAVPNGGSGSLKDDESWLERLCRVPRGLQIHLATVWAMSHFVFASCMFATLCVLFLSSHCKLNKLTFGAALRTAYGGLHSSSLSPDFHGL